MPLPPASQKTYFVYRGAPSEGFQYSAVSVSNCYCIEIVGHGKAVDVMNQLNKERREGGGKLLSTYEVGESAYRAPWRPTAEEVHAAEEIASNAYESVLTLLKETRLSSFTDTVTLPDGRVITVTVKLD